MILSGVGGGVPHVYEFEKHSRLGDVVVSAPAAASSPGGKPQPWYIFCENVDEVMNGHQENGGGGGGELRFTSKKFAPKDSVLLKCAQALIEAGSSSWHPFIKEGLQNLKDHEFDYQRPPADSDKLKIQVSIRGISPSWVLAAKVLVIFFFNCVPCPTPDGT